MSLKTFEQWSKMGYKVKKGSKHVARNITNECLFNDQQVEKFQQKEYDEEHWHEMGKALGDV